MLVISADRFNAASGTVIALAITSKAPRVGWPLAHELTTVRMPKRSWVKMGHVRTLSVQRLGRRIGHVADEELEQVVEGLKEIVD